MRLWARSPRALLLLLALLVPPLASAHASVLGLRPLPPDPPDRFVGEGAAQLLARADELEASLGQLSPEARPEAELTIAECHLETQMPKHRETALEICRELRLRRDDDLRALLLEAKILAAQGQLLPAIRLLHQREERFAENASFEYALGYYHFQKALPLSDPEHFRAARRYFLRATRIERENRKHRLALAAAGLLVKDLDAVLVATSVDAQGQTAVLPALLLRACALFFDGRTEASHYTFQSAFDRMLPEWRDAYLSGSPFLDPDGVDPEAARRFWVGVDPHPTKISNDRQVEFWVRMTEADLRFGSMEDWTPGWETQTGALWARWGPPRSMSYAPATPQPFAAPSRPNEYSHLDWISESSPLPRDLRGPKVGFMDIDPNVNRWRWIYTIGDQALLVNFVGSGTDLGWSMSSESANRAEPALERMPLVFQERGPAPSFALDIAAAGFLAGDGDARLELTLGVVPDPELDDGGLQTAPGDSGAAPYDIDWAVFDSTGKRIDHDRIGLDRAHRRSTLLRRVDPQSSALQDPEDPLLAQLALMLPPDRYHIAFEARHLASREIQTAQLAIDLGLGLRDSLALSDLQITDTYLPWDGETELPPEFVKHAQILVPRPNRSFPKGHRETFVYYEVSGLRRDDAGRAHFDVTYELEPLRVELTGDVGAQRRAQVQRQAFPEELVGLSEGGVVVKGTRVDLSQLDHGPWMLRVVVEDLLAQRHVSREIEIQIR